MKKTIIISCAFLLLGTTLGQQYERINSETFFCPITIKEKELSSVLILEEITPLYLKGKVQGNSLRLKAGSKLLEVKKDETFIFSSAEKYFNLKRAIPKNHLFFSSARSKYFYSTQNLSQMEKIRPENLVFYKENKDAVVDGKTFKK